MKDNRVPISKNECCGCTTCSKICPVNAIEMKNDSEGFAYPVIDESKCVHCGICLKNCAFYNNTKNNDKTIANVYVAKHNSQECRINSQSGGMFIACSDWILKQDGSIYGCILDKNKKVIHVRATNKNERDMMCKSKYVQSNMNGIFELIETDLVNGMKVLFTGTGCQVDGLLNYLNFKKVNLENLYTIDIICHGSASPLIFEEYINWLERKYKSEVTEFRFRDKTVSGWDGHIESFKVKDKKIKSTIYREIFHTDLCLRPSCYECKYATLNRNSDLTIGDAWAIKQSKPDFNDNKGVSMIIVQNSKGKKLLEEIEKVCDVIELPIESMMQPNLKSPSKPKGNREEFWKDYYDDGIEKIINKYGKMKLSKRMKESIKYKLRKIIKGKKMYLP